MRPAAFRPPWPVPARPLRALATLAAAGLVAASPPGAGIARAAWPSVPTTGVAPASFPVAGFNGLSVWNVVPDGAGGVFVVFDVIVSGNQDLYAQRLDARGERLWGESGVVLCAQPNSQIGLAAVPDDSGGVLVVWRDSRTAGNGSDLYAQRVSASGTPLWAPDGIAVNARTGEQTDARAVSDGAGGMIVAWVDTRSGTADIYAQRVRADGSLAWNPNGSALCTAADDQFYPAIATDGAGGAVVAWADRRGGIDYDLYARRVNANGSAQWTANGVAVCTATGFQIRPALVHSPGAGTLVVWEDQRTGANTADIYAQRLSSSGAPQWAANGIALCAASGGQDFPEAVEDGLGGALVTWRNYLSQSGQLQVQRVSVGGQALWGACGVTVCARGASQYAKLVADGEGGAFLAWFDDRDGQDDVYAQHVDASGVPRWTADGVAVCRTAGDQVVPMPASDGRGGVIVAWSDLSGTGLDLLQRVDRHGFVGAPEPRVASVRDVANDEGGRVKLSWDASYLDPHPSRTVARYWILRSAAAVGALGAGPVALDDPAAFARALREAPGAPAAAAAATAAGRAPDAPDPAAGEAPGPPRARLATTNGTQTYYWEHVATVGALHVVPGYSAIVATTGDAFGGSTPYTSFLVVALDAAEERFWLSAPDSGYSVDDLAPAAPAAFAAEFEPSGTRLRWQANAEPDLAGYRVYRGVTPDFATGPGSFVAAVAIPGFTATAGAFYYKVTARDVHGNEGAPAVAAPPGTVDVTPAGAAGPLALAAPGPNPARARATLAFVLPAPGPARLALFDVAGRRVRTLHDGWLAAGSHALGAELRDDAGAPLAAGLYFVRLESAHEVRSRRLVVVR